MTNYSIETAADGSIVVMTTDMGERIELDAAAADELITRLARARAALADQVPPALDPASRLGSTPITGWTVQASQQSGRKCDLLLRHPGYGWLGFGISATQAEALRRALR